jgi:membrane protein YqaA with SNARE-associated domain
VIQHPARWLYYGAISAVSSVLGLYVIYELARRGGEAFLRKRLHERHIDRGLDVFRQYGLFTIIVPAFMPPPVPFKPFVLLAGVAEIRPLTFILAVAGGRGFRYVGEAWLAYRYGDQALEFMRTNFPAISLWVAAAIVVAGTAVLVWRRRRTA